MDRAGNYSLQNVKTSSGGSIRKSLNKIIRNKKHNSNNVNNRLSLPSCNDVIKYDLPSPGALERAGSMTSLYVEREVDLNLIKESQIVDLNAEELVIEENYSSLNKVNLNKKYSEMNNVYNNSNSDYFNNIALTNNNDYNDVEDISKYEDVFTSIKSVSPLYVSPTNSPNTQKKLGRTYAVMGLSKKKKL